MQLNSRKRTHYDKCKAHSKRFNRKPTKIVVLPTTCDIIKWKERKRYNRYSECKDDKRLNEPFVAIFPTMLLKKIRKSMIVSTIAYGTC